MLDNLKDQANCARYLDDVRDFLLKVSFSISFHS